MNQKSRIILLLLTFITEDLILCSCGWLLLLLIVCWYCCDCCCFCCCSAIKLGDCGFELGGEIITFLLMSINTAAVSRCSCCSWVRFLTCISCCCCWWWCSCCCCFGSCWICCCWGTCCWGWCRCIVWWIIDGCCCCCCWLEDEVIFILSIGITDTEFASRFCRCVLLSTEVTDFAVWLLLLRNAWRAAIASCSADAFAANEAGEEAIRCSSFSDDCERISCGWEKKRRKKEVSKLDFGLLIAARCFVKSWERTSL